MIGSESGFVDITAEDSDSILSRHLSDSESPAMARDYDRVGTAAEMPVARSLVGAAASLFFSIRYHDHDGSLTRKVSSINTVAFLNNPGIESSLLSHYHGECYSGMR
jgi:hypothetical protein